VADLVLVDDPGANDLFDLKGLLGGGASGYLAASVVPKSGADGPQAGLFTVAWAADAGGRDDRRDGTATMVIEALLDKPALPFAVVAFVSAATLPFLEALYADERTRGVFKLGVTGPRLDTPYNLARKLIRDGKIHYHEHTLTLPVVLHKRLATMQRAHAATARGH
jgi:hypothetical protein